MKTITFKTNNEKDLMLLKMVSERLGISSAIKEEKNISKKTLAKSNGKAMYEALSKIAEIGNSKTIKNPVDWQRELRAERKLPNR